MPSPLRLLLLVAIISTAIVLVVSAVLLVSVKAVEQTPHKLAAKLNVEGFITVEPTILTPNPQVELKNAKAIPIKTVRSLNATFTLLVSGGYGEIIEEYTAIGFTAGPFSIEIHRVPGNTVVANISQILSLIVLAEKETGVRFSSYTIFVKHVCRLKLTSPELRLSREATITSQVLLVRDPGSQFFRVIVESKPFTLTVERGGGAADRRLYMAGFVASAGLLPLLLLSYRRLTPVQTSLESIITRYKNIVVEVMEAPRVAIKAANPIDIARLAERFRRPLLLYKGENHQYLCVPFETTHICYVEEARKTRH